MANKYKNRVKEFKIMRSGDILDNKGNWHVHPQFQSEATEGSLGEVGIVDVLIAYHSERNGGKLTLLDGHDRKGIDPEQEWPVIILDITDEEADTQLAMHDNIGKWGQIDPVKLQTLIARAKPKNDKAQEALARLREQIAPQVELARRMAGDEEARKPKRLVEDYEGKMKLAVHVVIPVEDGLATIEKAIKETGIRHRGKAMLEVCRFYLDNKGETDESTPG